MPGNGNNCIFGAQKMRTVKTFCATLFLSFTALAAGAQAIEAPVKWSYAVEEAGEGQFDLVITADIIPGWYLYSQHLGEDGPIPTTISFNESGDYELLGETEEAGEKVEGMDTLFDMYIVKFKKQATFTRRIRAGEGLEEVTGYIEFMTCDEEKCLPPTEQEFTFSFRK